jgi:hypothetical protein
MPSFETAARSPKVTPIIVPVHGDVEIEAAITALGREPGGGLVVMPDGFTGSWVSEPMPWHDQNMCAPISVAVFTKGGT